MTIESICNQALDLIGYERHIGNIWEGSKAARIALNMWGETRDALLFAMKPDWARKDSPLTLVKQAPSIVGPFANYDVTPWSNTYPPLPWLYEYSIPADLIQPVSIKSQDLTVPNFRPRAIPFQHTSSNTIVTNVSNAILVYIGKITNPDDWENDFLDLMIKTLAQKFSMELGRQPMRQKDGDASE